MTAWAEWHDWLEANFAPSTVATYNAALSLFLRSVRKPLKHIDEADITGWLRQFPYRSAKRRTYYQGLTNAFAFFERRLYILVNPTTYVRVPAVIEKVPRALKEDQVVRLVAAAADRAPIRGLYVAFLYLTGARLNESANVRWSDIEEDGVILRVTKGGRERTIPIEASLREVIDRLRDFTGEHEHLFPRASGTLWSWVRDAARDAGLGRVHPHMLRSSFATEVILGGADVVHAAKLLGHRNIRTTQRYVATSETGLRAAVAPLSVGVALEGHASVG